MISQTVKYKNLFTGEEVTEELYFNLTAVEVAELELKDGGVEGILHRLGKANDGPSAYIEFKRLVGLAYGRRVENGNGWEKREEWTRQLMVGPAYDALIKQWMNNEAAVREVFIGMLPAETQKQFKGVEKLKLTPEELQKMSKEDLIKAMEAKNISTRVD